jgi:hypothetical protein
MFVALISPKKVLQTFKMAENRHLDGKIVFSSFLKTLAFQIYIIQKSAHKGGGGGYDVGLPPSNFQKKLRDFVQKAWILPPRILANI